jgi:nucleoside phosphorylase
VVESDATLVATAQAAEADWEPEPWPASLHTSASSARTTPKVLTGAIGSAEVWTQAQDQLDYLHQTHGTLCEEMEAAAIGVICHRANVPFLPIKDISNNEFLRPTTLTDGMQEFPFPEVGKRAADLVLRLIERL